MNKQCICCLRTKPLTEFSKQPTNADGHDRTCKECRARLQKARVALKSTPGIVGPTDWPLEVKEYEAACRAQFRAGGKIPKFAQDLMALKDKAEGLSSKELSAEFVTPEAFLLLKADVDELQSRLTALEKNSEKQKVESSNRYKSVARIQRIDKLNRTLLADPEPLSIMGDEEYQVFLQGVTSVIASVKVGAGLPNPMDILSIVGQLSDFGMQCPGALETLYREFFQPYIAEHKDDGNYEELSSKFPAGMNLYELDWLEVLKS